MKDNKEILSIDVNNTNEYELISNKILELENSLKKPIFSLLVEVLYQHQLHDLC